MCFQLFPKLFAACSKLFERVKKRIPDYGCMRICKTYWTTGPPSLKIYCNFIHYNFSIISLNIISLIPLAKFIKQFLRKRSWGILILVLLTNRDDITETDSLGHTERYRNGCNLSGADRSIKMNATSLGRTKILAWTLNTIEWKWSSPCSRLKWARTHRNIY